MERKNSSKKIVALTAYDYSFSRLLDATDLDIILVGDSLAMVSLGHDTTLPVSMEEMIMHTRAVSKGCHNALLVADMPFMSYQPSNEYAIKNAGQLIKEGGADAVKLEGGIEYVDRISTIIEAGVPVMGHIGLKPQSILTDSGYKIHGKEAKEALQVYNDAVALEKAGVFSIVLEGVPKELAKIITKKLQIPTIGIGAGEECDGQIQVFHDLVGMFNAKVPKHAKKYIDNYNIIKTALQKYCKSVANKKFPHQKNSVEMNSNELEKLKKNIENI